MKRSVCILCSFLVLFFAVFQNPPRAEAAGESQVASLVLAAMSACGLAFSVSGNPSDADLISGVDSLLNNYSSAASTAIPSWDDIKDGVSSSGGFLRVAGESSAMTFLHGFLSWFGLSYGGELEPTPLYSGEASYTLSGIPLNVTYSFPGTYIFDSFTLNGHSVYFKLYSTSGGGGSSQSWSGARLACFVDNSSSYSFIYQCGNRFSWGTPVADSVKFIQGNWPDYSPIDFLTYSSETGSQNGSGNLTNFYQNLASAVGLSSVSMNPVSTPSSSITVSGTPAVPAVDTEQDWLISAPAGTQFGEGLLDGSLSDALTGIRSDVLDGSATAEQTVAGTATATESISVSEGQSSITSLWNWALGYISPDDGLFSKFPFCVPYDMYYFFSRLNSGSSSSMLNWSKSGLSSISSGSSPSTSSYSVNVGSNISVSGISLPLSGTLNLTPYLTYLHFIRVMLSIIFIAIFIASFRKGGDD